MTTCVKCQGPFAKDDKHVTCVICLNLFHANYTKGKNCADINASEERIVEMKKKCSFVYRCDKCTATGGLNPEFLEIINSMNNNIAKIEAFNSKVDEFTKNIEELTTFTKSVNSIKTYLHTISNKTLPDITAEIKNVKTIVIPDLKKELEIQIELVKNNNLEDESEIKKAVP